LNGASPNILTEERQKHLPAASTNIPTEEHQKHLPAAKVPNVPSEIHRNKENETKKQQPKRQR
jgi:hypothetical protein